MTPYDPRADAFEALLPLAAPIDRAVRRTQLSAAQLFRENRDEWAIWNSSQVAAVLGQARFSWLTGFCKLELRAVEGATYFSTPAQERQNLFLWTVHPRLGLRIKHDPDELSEDGDDTLFSMAPHERDQTACLTWTTGPPPTIDAVRFQAGHGSSWTIPLAELLAELEQGQVRSLIPTPRVKSRKEATPKTGPREEPR